MKRAQTELLGLVFIVILVIVGLLLYAGVANRGSAASSIDRALAKQEAVAFLTALTYVDSGCGVSIGKVAIACQERTPAGFCPGDACDVLDDLLERAGEQLLYPTGMRYNLSLYGSDASAVSECESADRTVPVIIDQPLPVGITGSPLHLAICSATYKKIVRS